MFKEKITYVNIDGEEVTETFYFNFTQAEATEFNLKVIGDKPIENYVQALVEARNYGELVTIFKELILATYGEKIDGRFVKYKNGIRLADYFAATEAYSWLFNKLATDDKYAAEFVNKVTPAATQPSVPSSVKEA